jgi:hypothetical protein
MSDLTKVRTLAVHDLAKSMDYKTMLTPNNSSNRSCGAPGMPVLSE